ncbi:Protein of uncharacterised function (DUF1194) [Pannonibacter phragmitetus]|uniref:Protein of uncharacterized function (DUF1194) n=1 Tax=Pannonibacter phragmitetus TaxID=121719 RepID=A0A378ZRL8_9HYPH|nr:DUF1194 domain-containing protein [Pannonibacter phragmitetus]SUA99623.1 Protein of uncharacterised function (DUF1194) [Pannonibacter phragmitetus]
MTPFNILRWLRSCAGGFRAALVLLALPAVTGRADAQQKLLQEVDVALVLAVDISYSMDIDEQRLQRQGYMQAITSPEVLTAIRSGLTGSIAVTYVEWAGTLSRSVLIDWHVVSDGASAQQFADALGEAPINRAYRTAIGDALLFSAEQFDTLPHRALRKVIDISGDGPNNQGTYAPVARDQVVAQGIIINGLPLQLKDVRPGWFDMEDLDRYYETCVIGGPGSFIVPVRGPERFAEAVRRKLVLEIAMPVLPQRLDQGAARLIRVSDGIDPFCLEGERRWQQRRFIYEEP